MARIWTLPQMRDYIKTTLGHPVINVEIADTQLDQLIEDSIDDFNRTNYGEGSYLDYTLFTLSAGVTEYDLSGNNIMDVFDFGVSMGADGINTMFTPTHILLHEQWVGQGGYPGAWGSWGPFSDNGMVLGNYQISMMYLETINEMFGKMYQVNYLPNREVLRVYPTPTEQVTGALALYRKEQAMYLYNHPLIKRLTVGRARIRWGWHLGKYAVTLPDGMTINADAMIAQGKEEEQAALEEIRLTSEPVDFYIA